MSSKLKSELGKARGLGSSKTGVDHWWAQRVTALALIPLVIWFVYSFVILMKAANDYQVVVHWIQSPVNAVMSILLICTAFYHGALGLRVVIEDYIECPCSKIGWLLITKFGSFFAAAMAVFSILTVYFKG